MEQEDRTYSLGGGGAGRFTPALKNEDARAWARALASGGCDCGVAVGGHWMLARLAAMADA